MRTLTTSLLGPRSQPTNVTFFDQQTAQWNMRLGIPHHFSQLELSSNSRGTTCLSAGHADPTVLMADVPSILTAPTKRRLVLSLITSATSAIRSVFPSPPPPASMIERMAYSEGIWLQDLQRTSFQRLRHAIGESQVVLVGEATHGTEDFYRIRAELTKVLVEEDGFDAIICEGDFPSFYELNRFTGGAPAHMALAEIPTQESAADSSSAKSESPRRGLDEAMAGFKARFPEFIWLNNATREFVLWLKEFNLSRRRKTVGENLPVQLLGLDIYRMFQSAQEVTNYLVQTGQHELARRAQFFYSTVNSFGPEPRDYSVAVDHDPTLSQARNVAIVLAMIRREKQRLSRVTGDDDELFNALENARITIAAEAYYRNLFAGSDILWNLRDIAFLDMVMETIEFVKEKKRRQGLAGAKARVVVWAHNSHVGDVKATEDARRGVDNLGHLCRRTFGKGNVYIVGLLTHGGTVRAAPAREGRDQVMQLNPSVERSHEHLLHRVSRLRKQNGFGYTLRSNSLEKCTMCVDEAAREVLSANRMERFVGVTYTREDERQKHYSLCRLSDQFDFLLHVDHSTALRVHQIKPT